MFLRRWNSDHFLNIWLILAFWFDFANDDSYDSTGCNKFDFSASSWPKVHCFIWPAIFINQKILTVLNSDQKKSYIFTNFSLQKEKTQNLTDYVTHIEVTNSNNLTALNASK